MRQDEWYLLAAMAAHAIPICGADYAKRLETMPRDELNSALAIECVDLVVALMAECKKRGTPERSP